MTPIKELLTKWLGLSYYTSELDQFLAKFDREHPSLSLSQRKEKDKYDRIHLLRDRSVTPTTKTQSWDNF